MDVKKTITSIFIVPTLGIPRDKLTENGYINGYVLDSRRDIQYRDSVYVLFRPENLEKFRDFLDDEYDRTKSIIDDYDYEDGYVVLVYMLDDKYRRDFDLIKKGRYSKTSPEFQALFPKIVKIKVNGLHKDELSLQYRVFNKTEDLRIYWEEKLGVDFDEAMEVWSGYTEEKEILNLENFKQHA